MAGEMGCRREALGVVAMVSTDSVFLNPRGRTDEADEARRRFMSPEGDQIMMLQVRSISSFLIQLNLAAYTAPQYIVIDRPVCVDSGISKLDCNSCQRAATMVPRAFHQLQGHVKGR